MRTLPLLAAAGCALLALSGCGTQHAGESASPAPTDPHQSAVADAARIIASFPVPPGSVPSARPPLPLLDAPAMGPQATPDVVTASRWWTASGQPQSVLAWVAAHVPAGFTLGGHGSAGTSPGLRFKTGQPQPEVQHPYSWFDEFDLPVVPNVLTQRSLLVEVVRDGTSRTAIRVDAQVVWLPAKPAAGRMPSGATVVTVAPQVGVGPLPVSARQRRADRTVTITDPGDRRRSRMRDR
jgi:hypothetical protein